MKHGTFEEVEVQITKYRKEEEENKLEGGFYSKTDLEQEGWTPYLPHQLTHFTIPMISNADGFGVLPILCGQFASC